MNLFQLLRQFLLLSYFQLKPERAAFAFFAFNMQFAAMLFEQFVAHDQPQSASLLACRSLAGARAVEAEEFVDLFRAHADARVAEADGISGKYLSIYNHVILDK